MSPDRYDLVIIGGGSAGLTGAAFAAKIGARVAIVEGHRIGGDCTWTGCVPSKALLKAGKIAHEVRRGIRCLAGKASGARGDGSNTVLTTTAGELTVSRWMR